MLTAGALNQVYTGTSVVPVLPTHTTGDILIAVGMHNGAGTLSVSGWTEIGHESNSNLSSGAWYKIASSGAESNPTIISSGAASSTAGLFAKTFKAPGTSYASIIDATWSGPTTSTTPTGSTITTTAANALAVTLALIDSANAFSSGLPPSTWSTVSDESSENFSVPTVAAVSSAIAIAQTGTTLNVTLPSHQADDILVVVAAQTISSGTLTCDTSGWAKLDGTANAALSTGYFWKRATSASETTPTITTTNTASGTDSLYAVAFVIRGCITTGNPYDEFHKSTMALTASATTTSTTTAGFDRLLFAAFAVNDNNNFGTPPTDWSEHLDINTITGSDVQFGAMSRTVATPSTIGAATWTNSASDTVESITIAFIPASAGEGRITAIEKTQASAGDVTGPVVGTLPSASYWKTLSLSLEPSTAQVIDLSGNEISSVESVNSPTVVNILASQVINFIAQSTNTQSSSTTWTVNSPDIGVIQQGDYIIVGAMTDGVNIASVFPTGPAGDFFELIEMNENSDATLKMWYQAAAGGNGDPTSYSITWDTACAGVAFCIVYRGVTDISGQTASNQSSATTAHDWGPITPQYGKAVVVSVIGCDPAGSGLTFTWDAPWLERFDATNSNLAQVALADRAVSTPTSTSVGGDYPGGEGAAVAIFSLESRIKIDILIFSIASAESVSSPTITKRNTITLSTGQEIASAESVSQPTITKRNTITLNSINSSEAFENPTVRGLNRISVQNNSINSNEFHETFNGSNGVLGNGWLQRPLDGNAVYGNITIASNAAVGDSDTEGAWAYNPDFNHAANCEIWFDVASVSGGFVVEIEFATNNPDSTNWSGYSFDITQTGESWFYRVDNTSYTQIGYFTGATLAAGDRVRIKNNGGTLTADRYRNGSATFLVSAVDSTYGVGSGIGLYIDGNTGISIDNLWVSSIDTNSVNNPTITQGSITQTIVLTGHEIASAESVSQPTLSSRATITLNSINSSEAFDNPTVSNRNTITLNSINSLEAFENPTVSSRFTISTHSFGDSYGPEVLKDSPLWYNRYETGAVAGSLYDHSKNTQPNVVSTAVAVTAIDGPLSNDGPGQGLQRTNDQLGTFLAGTPTNQPSTAITVEIWFKTNIQGNWPNWVNNGWVSQGAYLLYASTTGPIFGLINPSPSQNNAFAARTYNDEKWHHTVGTYDGTAVVVYYDGIAIGTVNNANTQNVTLKTGGNIVLGGGVSAGTANYRALAEYATYGTALSPARILAHYEAAFDVPNATVGNRNTISLNSINSSETFENPTITSRNSIILTGNEIASAESVSNPSLSSRATISASSIDSLEAFGNPQLSIVITGSINSAESVSSPTVTSLRTIILTGNEIASAESVSNPTLVKFNTIAPNSVNSAEVFDNPTLTHRATIILTGNEIGSAESVSQPTVSNARTIVLTGQEIGSGFAADNPTVSSRATIAPNSINSAEAFDNPTIQKLNTIVLNSINSAESVNNPIVVNVNTIVPNSINSSEVVDNPSISNLATIVLNSINSAESVNNPTVLNQNTISVNSIDSAEAFSNPNVLPIFPVSITSAEFVDQPVILTGAFLIQPNAIDSAESVNNPTITTGGVTIALNSVNSGEAFENPIVTSLRVITLNSINSSETFDNPVVSNKNTITPNSIASSEVVNNPIVLNLATIILNSIASSEAVDNPNVTTRTTINLSSYDGSDTPNNPVVSTFNLISLNSVNSAESVNNPIVSSSSIVNLNPINPDEIVNEIVLTTLSQIYPDTFGGDTFSTDLEVFLVVPGPQGAGGISSLEALGLPRFGFGINPNSITSEEVVSSPFIVSPITIWIVNPISSSEGFGSVIITNNRIQPISGISVSGTSIVYPPVHSAGGTGVVIIGSAIVVPSPGTPANPGGSVTIGTVEGVRTPLL